MKPIKEFWDNNFCVIDVKYDCLAKFTEVKTNPENSLYQRIEIIKQNNILLRRF